MSKKILLINPPIAAMQFEWEHGLGSRLPPIGLCSLAAYIHKNGFEVVILDAYNLGLSTKDVLRKIDEFSPTHVGLTATTSYVDFAGRLSKAIKEHRQDLITLIGGAHLSAMPYETMERFPDFDIGVIGEGEDTLLELLGLPETLSGLNNIKGIIYRERNTGKLNKTRARPYIDNLDRLPYPAWGFLPGFPNYYRPSPTNYKKLPVVSLVTSRGCPYQCTFCDRSVFGNRCRTFSAEYVSGLIEYLNKKYGVREITFYDDTFTVDKKRLNAICHYFLSHNLKLSWSCLGRVDLADATSLKLMKKAGCWLISYGIESASQEILDLYKKRINLAQIEHAIRITKQAGIQTRGFFMLGNPLESKDSLGRIKDLLRRLPLDDIHISFFTPIPGSESYNLSDRYGTFSRNWLDMDVYSLNFIPRDLTKDQLLKYRSQLYKSFYFRPARLMRYAAILFNPKRMLEIIKRGAVFIKLLSKNKY